MIRRAYTQHGFKYKYYPVKDNELANLFQNYKIDLELKRIIKRSLKQ